MEQETTPYNSKNGKKLLIIRPRGGLANRIRSLVSAILLAKAIDRNLLMCWDNYAVKFEELFDYPMPPQISSAEYKKHLAGDYGQAKLIHPGKHGNIEKVTTKPEEKTIIIVSGRAFYYQSEEEYLSELRSFVATKEITSRIMPLPKNTVGMHIRRTDNERSITFSPSEDFVTTMDVIASHHPDVTFYLATDDLELKTRIKKRYNNRVLTYDVVNDRHCSAGVKDALLELMTLSLSKLIIGSGGSSFSLMASDICGAKLLLQN